MHISSGFCTIKYINLHIRTDTILQLYIYVHWRNCTIKLEGISVETNISRLQWGTLVHSEYQLHVWATGLHKLVIAKVAKVS